MPILVETGKEGLILEAQHGDVAFRYHRTGSQTPERCAFPASLLDTIQGRTDALVSFQVEPSGRGLARWTEEGLPRSVEFSMAKPAEFPELPVRWAVMPASFRQALAHASATTTKDSLRWGLSRVQLRGKDGEVVGTDGSQLLIHGGIQFPFADNILVPRLRSAGLRELEFQAPIRLERTATHLGVRLGAWTFVLALDNKSRFPDVKSVLPATSSLPCRVRLDQADAAFLRRALPKLPGREDSKSPVTLDLAGRVTVRARAGDATHVTELVLSRSEVSGGFARTCLDRRFLLRALELDCRELHVGTPDQPLVCLQGPLTYVFVPLLPEMALGPAERALRVDSTSAPPERSPRSRKETAMSVPEANGVHANTSSETRAAESEALSEATELRKVLQEATGRVARLIAALKQQRRQDRVVRAAMSSLRQLKELGT